MMTDIFLPDLTVSDEVRERLKVAIDAIIEVVKRVVEAIKAVLHTFWKSLRDFLKRTNPKLFHLAYYHPKVRVRKKNFVRLFKMYMRKEKYNE